MTRVLKDRPGGSTDFASRKEGSLGPRTDWYSPRLDDLIVNGKHIGWVSRTPNAPGFEVMGFVCGDLDWFTLEQDAVKARLAYRKHNDLADHDFGSIPGMLYLLKKQLEK